MPGPGSYLIGEEEKKEVLEVLESGYLFRYGSEDNPKFKRKVYTFEQELAKYMGVKHAIAINSGTGALLSCIAALGIGPGDEVIVPGYTFLASMSAIVYSRAIPILAEIDDSMTIDPADIEKKITDKTKAIMPVHMLGNPCNMDAVMAIAKKYGLHVIEDAAQATGGSYKGKKLGTIGNMGAYSLNASKTIGAGDGGALVVDDDNLYERAYGFHDQGHLPIRMGIELGRRTILGYTFRMNELTGAVALAQLRKIDKILELLREKKKKLKDAISDIKGIRFRRINDEGEVSTLIGIIFKDKDTARRFSQKIGQMTLYESGWHVYSNIEHLLNRSMPTEIDCPFSCPYYGKEARYDAHMLPQTDDLLERSVIISVGVIEPMLGSGFGINILSDDKEIQSVADRIKKTMAEIL
jgi:dTDP-4-amino-4,6-dideoxygalactose transaminase